jgi:hypothetical protein
MKRLFLICCVAVIALLSLSCTPKATLDISVSEIDNGIVVENVGNVDCIVFVGPPDSGQQFELAIGRTVTITGISKDAEISVVRS